MESMKLARSTKNDKRGRVAQLPRANISLRHEIYIQRCTFFARNDEVLASKNIDPIAIRSLFRAKISKRNESAMLKYEHGRGEKRKTRRNFLRCMSACTRMFVTWDPNMAQIKGTGQGFSTLRKKLRVLSFDSVGACFQRCFFRDD